MLKKFPAKFKYSIAIYTLNVYKTSTRKPPLIHSWELSKISIYESRIINIKNTSPYITLLQKTKSVKIIRLNCSDFLSDQYKIMMTDCRILYRNEEGLP